MSERSPRWMLGVHDVLRWAAIGPAMWIGATAAAGLVGMLAIGWLAGALRVGGAFEGGLVAPSLWFALVVLALWSLQLTLGMVLRRGSKRAKVAVKRLMWWSVMGAAGVVAAAFMQSEGAYGATPLTTLVVLAMVAAPVLAGALGVASVLGALRGLRDRSRTGRWGSVTATVYGLLVGAGFVLVPALLANLAPAAPAHGLALVAAWEHPALWARESSDRLARIGADTAPERVFTLEELGLGVLRVEHPLARWLGAQRDPAGETRPARPSVSPASRADEGSGGMAQRNAPSPAADPSPEALVLVAWNVNAGPFGDRDAQVPRVEEALRAWSEAGVGLLVLQEVEPDWVPRLSAALGPEYAHVMGRSGGMMRIVLFFRESRLSLRGWDELSSVVGGSDQLRAPVSARFTLDGAQPIEVIGVHLTRGDAAEDGRRRHEEAQRLAALSARGDEPLLVVGDFNADCALAGGPDACHRSFRSLLERGGTWIVPREPLSTTCSTRYDTMLDHVVAMRGAEQARGEVDVLTGYCDAMEPGAHRPLRASLSF